MHGHNLIVDAIICIKIKIKEKDTINLVCIFNTLQDKWYEKYLYIKKK